MGEGLAVTEVAPTLEQQLDSENRQLKATINALRLQMEEMQAQEGAHIQSALAANQAEIVQLKATINALRNEMERLQGQTEKRIEDSAAAARDENRHLRDMIVALRNQLEQQAAA